MGNAAGGCKASPPAHSPAKRPGVPADPGPSAAASAPRDFPAPGSLSRYLCQLKEFRLYGLPDVPEQRASLTVRVGSAFVFSSAAVPVLEGQCSFEETFDVRYLECAPGSLHDLQLRVVAEDDDGGLLGELQLSLATIASGPMRYDHRLEGGRGRAARRVRLAFQCTLEEEREWSVRFLEVQVLALSSSDPFDSELRPLRLSLAGVRVPGLREVGGAWGEEQLPPVEVTGSFRAMLQTMVHVVVTESAPASAVHPRHRRLGLDHLSTPPRGVLARALSAEAVAVEVEEEEDEDGGEAWLLLDKLYCQANEQLEVSFTEELYRKGVPVGTVTGVVRLHEHPRVAQMASGVHSDSGRIQAATPLVVSASKSWHSFADSGLPPELRRLTRLGDQLVRGCRQRDAQPGLVPVADEMLALARRTSKPAVVGFEYADDAALWRARTALLDLWASALLLIPDVIFRIRVRLFDLVAAVLTREELNTPNVFSLDEAELEASFLTASGGSGGSAGSLDALFTGVTRDMRARSEAPPSALTIDIPRNRTGSGVTAFARSRRSSVEAPESPVAGPPPAAARRRMSLSLRGPELPLAAGAAAPSKKTEAAATAFALRYHELLHDTLKYALPKLSGQLAEEPLSFCALVVGVCALRLPEFGETLFAVLLPEEESRKRAWEGLPSTPRGQHVAVPEWRGFRLEEHVQRRRAQSFQRVDAQADPALLSLNWGPFHSGLKRRVRQQDLRMHRRKLPAEEFWTSWLTGGDHVFRLCSAYVRLLIDSTAPLNPNVSWELLPGYREVLKFTLLELKARQPRAYPEQLVELTLVLQANRELVSTFVHIVFSRTNVHSLADVHVALRLAGRWFERVGAWGGLLAFGQFPLTALNATGRLPAHRFDYSFFFAAVDVLLQSDSMQVLLLSLAFLHNHWPVLPAQACEELRRRVLQQHFGTLFPHWQSEVRRFFATLLVFRLLGSGVDEPPAATRAAYNAALDALKVGDGRGTGVLRRPVPHYQAVYVPQALTELAALREEAFARPAPQVAPELWWEPVSMGASD